MQFEPRHGPGPGPDPGMTSGRPPSISRVQNDQTTSSGPSVTRSSVERVVVDRDAVLATLGYKAKRSFNPAVPVLENSELCLRCGKKVYPLERVDVGGYYHKGCFKCKVCQIQLTLKTFHRHSDTKNPKLTKEIYCKKHVPKAVGAYDAEALEIQRAVNAQKHASAQLMRRTGYEYDSHYDPGVTSPFQGQGQTTDSIKRRKKVRRRSTLRSSQDFEKHGVYDAQRALEAVHKQEEDELYRQMSVDRKRHVDKLERHLQDERHKTVQELIKWFDSRGATAEERQAGIKKIENFYAKQREERMQYLLQRLTMEEQAAVARIIEKHSTEMLVLIQEKEREAEKATNYEFRESQLLEDGVPRGVEGVDAEGSAGNSSEEEDTETDESDEEDEDEPEDTQEISFSEASYRVDLNEESGNARGDIHVPHPDVQRAQKTSYGSEGSLNLRESKCSTGGTVGGTEVQSFERHGSQRSNGRKGSRGSRRSNQASARSASDQNITQDHHQHPHNHHHQYQDHENPYQNNQPQSSHEYSPFGALPFETDDQGQVLVKVHAAKNAHLISDHLKSSHFCQSPSADKTAPYFYDFTSTAAAAEAPKPLRRRLAEKHNSTDTAERNKKNSNQQGGANAMLFRRPGEQDPQSDDSTNRQSGTGKRQKQTKKKATRNTDGSTSKERRHRRKLQQQGEGDMDVNTLVRQHAHKAKAALRNMSMGLAQEDEGDEEVFLNVEPTAPKIAPPKTRKRNLYQTPEVFKELDENAVNETKREHNTFTELVRTLSKKCKNELQRVRAIFRWITAKDLNKLEIAETVDPESPIGILRGIKYGVESYHDLFKRLCSYAGIHCEIIEGYSKGAGYRPGGRFKGDDFRNQWTAVCVDGAWRFVNCNWGSRHVKDRRDDKMTYKCDEFYFLTDPEDHIYQHFPDDPDWQLLKNPITLEQFVKLPVLKSPFFNRHLKFAVDYDSTIRTADGKAEIRMMSPKIYSYSAQLKTKDDHIKPEVLKGRVLVRLLNEEVVFITNLPSTGNYYLEIYVGKSQDSMDNACAFRLCCYSVASNVHLSFPPVSCFGRTPHFKASNIREETHTDPYVVYKSELLVAMLCPPDIKLSHTLRYWNHRDRKLEDLDRYAFLLHRTDHLASFTVQCPRRGGYVFALLADHDTEGSSSHMKCVYRYYIECRSPSENAHPLPKASKRWQGCRLIEPMTGDLPCRSRVRFCVESAPALELVVSVEDKWLPLHKSGHLWQASVYTGDEKGRLFLYGKFDSHKDKYVPLLEYVVRSPRGMEEEVRTLLKYM